MKILMFPILFELGTTSVLLELAEEFRNRGHTVIFAGSGNFKDYVIYKGFEVENLPEVNHELYMKKISNANLDFHNKSTIASFVKSEINLLKKVSPDVVFDVFRPTLYISSKVTSIPRINISNTVLTKYYNADLSIPEGYWLYNFTNINPLISNIAHKIFPTIKDVLLRHWVNPYNEVLKKYNLPRLKSVLDLFDGDITFLMDASEFAPVVNLPANVLQFGPITHNFSANMPVWFNNVRKKNGIKLYVSMGSTGTMIASVLRDLIEIYGNKENFYIISNTVFPLKTSFSKLPSNFFISDFLPPQKILNIVDLVITHGGRGSVYHALTHGVPIIGIPHQTEQQWNVERVENLGLGIKISPKKYSPILLKNAIDEILSKTIYRNNAQDFQNKLSKYNAIPNIVNFVEYKYAKKG